MGSSLPMTSSCIEVFKLHNFHWVLYRVLFTKGCHVYSSSVEKNMFTVGVPRPILFMQIRGIENCSTPSATNRETSQRFCEIVIGFVGNMFFNCDEISYRTFKKHENSEVQKPPSQLRFSLPSIINTITSNGP